MQLYQKQQLKQVSFGSELYFYPKYSYIYIFGPLLKLCPKFIVMRRFYLDLLKTNIFCCQSLLFLLLLSRQQNEIHRERKGRVWECVAWPKCKYRTEQQWQVKPTQDGHKHLHRCSEIPILHIFFLSLSLSFSLSVCLPSAVSRLDNAPIEICMEICFCAIRRYQFICDISASRRSRLAVSGHYGILRIRPLDHIHDVS